MNFANVNHIAIPEGNVKRITSGGVELWNADYLRITSLLLDGYNIDTGVLVPTGGDTELVIDMVCPDSSAAPNNTLIGGMLSVLSQGTWFGGSPSATWTLGSTAYSDVSIFDRSILRIVYNRDTRRQSLYVNGEYIAYRTFTATVSNNFNTLPLRFGQIRPATFPISVFSAKVYSLSTLVLDLIPVRRRSDNAECMLDKLSGNFYTKNLYT